MNQPPIKGVEAPSAGISLVTGADGFVGRALVDYLEAHGKAYRGVVRRRREAQGRIVALGDFAEADWRGVLQGVDCVFHLAARAHVMRETATDPLAAYRRANLEVSARLAEQAAAAGVRQLVFLSTVKVLGEQTRGQPFDEQSAVAPQDFYAKSKCEAEDVLRGISQLTGLRVHILRVPLVYGPEVKGNFLSLLRWVAAGRPLPLGAIRNQRSLLYVGNLCAALATLGEHSAQPSGTWLLSDGEAVSTPELLRAMAQALGVPARIWHWPTAGLGQLAAWVGKGAAWQRLSESLVVDSRAFQKDFDWQPPFSLAQGLAETAAWYRRGRRSL